MSVGLCPPLLIAAWLQSFEVKILMMNLMSMIFVIVHFGDIDGDDHDLNVDPPSQLQHCSAM